MWLLSSNPPPQKKIKGLPECLIVFCGKKGWVTRRKSEIIQACGWRKCGASVCWSGTGKWRCRSCLHWGHLRIRTGLFQHLEQCRLAHVQEKWKFPSVNVSLGHCSLSSVWPLSNPMATLLGSQTESRSAESYVVYWTTVYSWVFFF